MKGVYTYLSLYTYLHFLDKEFLTHKDYLFLIHMVNQ